MQQSKQADSKRLYQTESRSLLRERERVLAIGKPTRRFVGDELHLGSKGEREIRDLVAGGEVHQNRDLEIGDEVDEEIFELVLFRAIERELAEDDAPDIVQQSRRAKVEEPLVGDGHRIAGLFEEKNGVPRIDLVRSANRLLHQGKISAGKPTDSPARPHSTRDFASELGFGARRSKRSQKRVCRGIGPAREEIVERWPVKDAQLRSAH